MTAERIVVIDFFETFSIVAQRIPQCIIKIEKQGFVAACSSDFDNQIFAETPKLFDIQNT
jgi:hypothetical protein